jgi:tRNA U34 5-methylaminomethyl-2-thiouridine-forming methyltransferase MnmC
MENPEGIRERMHHSHGALSETLYIYGEALKRAQLFLTPLRTLSVGLGLGYNEVLIAAFALRHGMSLQKVVSYEQEAFLVQNFMRALHMEPSELDQAHSQVIEKMAQHFALDPMDIRQQLLNWSADTTWMVEGRWDSNFSPPAPFEVILYDPFSAKMNPDFWSEDNLHLFLSRWCAESCVFSTYAARGVLTRALRSHGFQVDKRPGFSGKKDCTFAIRDGHSAS